MSFNSPTLGLIDADRIENGLTGPQLVVVFNEIGQGDTVKRFSALPVAILRVKKALSLLDGLEKSKAVLASIKPTDLPPKTKPLVVVSRTGVVNKVLGKDKDPAPTGTSRFCLSASGTILPHRPNTRRGSLIRLMAREQGATLDEMVKESDWTLPEVRSIIKTINSSLGHAIEEDAEGNIRIPERPVDRKPFNLTPAENIKTHRPKTKRALVIQMLSAEGGTTVAAVRQVTGWNEAQAYQGIILVNKYVGHGLSEDDQGNIRIC